MNKRINTALFLFALFGCVPTASDIGKQHEKFNQLIQRINQDAYERGRAAKAAGVSFECNPEIDGPFDNSRSMWAKGWVDESTDHCN